MTTYSLKLSSSSLMFNLCLFFCILNNKLCALLLDTCFAIFNVSFVVF